MPEESIFHAALALNSAERASYLAHACGANEALRRRVDALLNAYGEGEFLEMPVADLVASARMPAMSERPGELIGPYKLLEQIGEGGMGLVFMAEQTRPLMRRVALKIIKPGMDTRAVIARFEAERQALALMDHPNIARVFDAGATAGGRPYFVMELVRGAPITDFCRDRAIGLRERLDLFTKVCDAVQHAHQKGVIHRDLKPTNILVGQSDTAPLPKVIDFGVAKATSQQLTERTLFTHFAQVIGTPTYMSPEQADLGNQDVDTRSDVYSLGVVLYELLTGKTPFDGERLRTAGTDEMRRIIREEDPPRPSTRAKTEAMAGGAGTAIPTNAAPCWASALTGELDWIVMKALDKDRRRRYESAAALAADVRRHLENEPIQAAPPSALYLVRKFVHRRRVETVVGLTLLAACVIGVIALVVSKMAITQALEASRKAEQQAYIDRERYRSARDRAEDNLYVSDVRLAHEEWTQGNVAAADRLLSVHIPGPNDVDRRGWEWHYLNGLRHGALVTLGDEKTRLKIVDWSADGRYLAAATDTDFTIRIWDATTHREMAQLTGHAASLEALAWSPTASRIASSDVAGVIRIWDVDSGSSTVLVDTGEPERCVAWSPDGTQLATCCDTRNQVLVWHTATGRQLARMDAPHGVWSVAWSPDGSRLASSDNFQNICIWDAARGNLLERRKDAHGHAITTVSWSPDGRQLASGSWDNVVKIWDVHSWTAHELRGHRGQVFSVRWRPDGAELASSAGDGGVIVWDVHEMAKRRVLRGHGGSVSNVCWNSDGTRLATASRDGTVKLWDPTRDQEFAKFASRSHAAWSPDGQRLVALAPETAEAPAALQIANNQGQPQGAPIPVTTAHGPISGLRPRVAWSPNGCLIAVAFSTKKELCVQVVDAETGADVLTRNTPRMSEVVPCDARSVTFSPDSTLVAIALLNRPRNEIGVWEIATGQRIASLVNSTTWPVSLAFSPDGRRLAAPYLGNQLKIWNTTTWRETLTLDRSPGVHRGGGHMVTWSPDGSTFASGNSAGEVILWNANDGRAIRSWAAHASQLFAIAFSPDGTRLATGGEDHCVKIWNPNTGDHLLTLRSYPNYGVRDLAWSSDGRRLLSCSDESDNFVWTALSAGPATSR